MTHVNHSDVAVSNVTLLFLNFPPQMMFKGSVLNSLSLISVILFSHVYILVYYRNIQRVFFPPVHFKRQFKVQLFSQRRC